MAPWLRTFKFSFQNTQVGTQPLVTLALRDPIPSSVICGHMSGGGTYIEEQAKHI